MGKITDALKKAAEERVEHIEKINRLKRHEAFVVKKMEDSRVDPRIITYFDSKATIAEQYKILRTNILSLNVNNPPKVIVVTSSTHSEGKTITSLNLAMAISQSKSTHRVLVIDADLRRGKIGRYLGVRQEKGLSELLTGDAELEDVVFNIDVPNLSFIAAGSVPPQPVDLLDSKDMKELLEELRSSFDLIIIDAPPIINVTDAGIIGSLADGVLMVIQAGRTQRGIVRHAEELLYQAHAKVLGHVLTNIQYHLPEYIYRYL
ncbi:MAG: CpsD/CapB family tyrosine-protein kinase [Candidatus Omnitrophota bacterium]